MSVWKRLFGLEGAETPPEEPKDPPEPARPESRGEEQETPEGRFTWLGDSPGRVASETEVIQLFDGLENAGRAARALDLARRVSIDKPVVRARYAYAETGPDGLGPRIDAFCDGAGVGDS